jgi:hypothetical protein
LNEAINYLILFLKIFVNNIIFKVKGWKEKMRDIEQWRLVVEKARADPGL